MRKETNDLWPHCDGNGGHLAAMTASELRDLILQKLAKENGGGTLRWRKVLGDIKVYPRTTHAHCNWDARPSGSVRDVSLVESAIDRTRLRYPFVEA